MRDQKTGDEITRDDDMIHPTYCFMFTLLDLARIDI